jgi:hypothetical protein
MRIRFCALLFLSVVAFSTPMKAHAQQPGTFIPIINGKTISAPPDVPEIPFNPWRISYFGEYQGPALNNFDIMKTQYPSHPQVYTEWDHSLKLGYAVSKDVTVGTQFRAFNPTDPSLPFGFYDQRFYVQWNHMIDTSDISIAGKFGAEVPTTDTSRNSGEIISLRINAYVTLKTELRNWNFAFDFLLQPYFFNDPVSNGGQTDLYFGVFPYITLDVIPNVQILFEGSFDANHNYNSAFNNFGSAYNDYIDVGPLFMIGSHMSTNIALRFFTDNLSPGAAAIYGNIGLVL